MKSFLAVAMAMIGAMALMACNDQPVQRVQVPGPSDQSAYRPMLTEKPMPPPGYVPGLQPQEIQGQPMRPGQPAIGPAPSIPNEDGFVAAYMARPKPPRIMVFVNRTIQGDPVDNDYQIVEASLVQYFDNSGKVQIQDSDAARAKLGREDVLRIENGDPAANRLLSVELQQDVLILVTARPTNQSSNGAGIRLIAKAVSTADARNLGTSFVDMPSQLSKTNVNIFTQKLASDLMAQMAVKWSQPPQYDPIEVRIYKAATVEDALHIRDWIKKTANVTSATVASSTGMGATAYAVLSVGFAGAPEDFYGNLKDLMGLNQGLKVVDLTGTTISLEITGPLALTTTRRSETKTTVETTTTEERKVEPINPAPPQ